VEGAARPQVHGHDLQCCAFLPSHNVTATEALPSHNTTETEALPSHIHKNPGAA